MDPFVLDKWLTAALVVAPIVLAVYLFAKSANQRKP